MDRNGEENPPNLEQGDAKEHHHRALIVIILMILTLGIIQCQAEEEAAMRVTQEAPG